MQTYNTILIQGPVSLHLTSDVTSRMSVVLTKFVFSERHTLAFNIQS